MFRRLLLLALLPNFAFAWGFDGHRRLASMMQEPLPANHCLTAWFTARQTAALQDRACDPDRFPAFFEVDGQRVGIRLFRPNRPAGEPDTL